LSRAESTKAEISSAFHSSAVVFATSDQFTSSHSEFVSLIVATSSIPHSIHSANRDSTPHKTLLLSRRLLEFLKGIPQGIPVSSNNRFIAYRFMEYQTDGDVYDGHLEILGKGAFDGALIDIGF
jgi:hypothetical protein